MKSYHPTRSALIATALLCGFSLTASAQKADSPTATVKDYFGDDKIILDTDGDGWDDLWTTIYPELKHRSKTTDTDGDGVTDYEEMVLWRNPMEKGPMPHKPTPEEIAEGLRLAEIAKVENQARLIREWPAKQAELAVHLRPLFDGKGADPEEIRNDSAALKQAATQRVADVSARAADLEQDLNEIAEKYGIAREGFDENNRGYTLVGESPAGPLLMTTQNVLAANTIGADDLWPTGLHSWQNTALTRNLTGSGVTTAIFEAGAAPGIRTNHIEFSGRAAQVTAVTAGNHATAVADVIAGGGIMDVFRSGTNYGKLLRGVAYQSSIRGNDLNSFVANSTASATGGQRFSNHSYGLSGGWGTVTDGVNNYWFWPNNSFTEEPRFGMYSSSAPGTGISSADLDSFVKTNATQLPVFAAGNPNNYGPNVALSGYYTLVGGSYVVSSVVRDWYNGDAGGYDTVISPATAKNVLCVGSILDVNGSTVTLSSFSGTGPTDDGRIKPDLVAVGQRNSSLGLGTSLFLASAASTSSYYNGITLDTENNASMQGDVLRSSPSHRGACIGAATPDPTLSRRRSLACLNVALTFDPLLQ